MKIGPFTVWGPMHTNGTPCPGIVVAALHWRSSITWSWAIYWSGKRD